MPQIDIQQLYDDIKDKKNKRKEIKASIKEHYDTSPTFKKINDELKTLKAKKKAYDIEVKELFSKDFEEIVRVSQEVSADEELLSDLCFRELMANRPVEIKDQFGKKYEPVIKVSFKKMD